MTDIYRVALLAAPILSAAFLLWRERKPSQERADARWSKTRRYL